METLIATIRRTLSETDFSDLFPADIQIALEQLLIDCAKQGAETDDLRAIYRPIETMLAQASFVKTEMTADAVFLLSLLCAAGGHSASHHGSFHPHAIASLAHSIGKQITLLPTVGNTSCSVEALNDQKQCFYNAFQVTNSLASGQIRACVVRYFLFELSGIGQTLEF